MESSSTSTLSSGVYDFMVLNESSHSLKASEEVIQISNSAYNILDIIDKTSGAMSIVGILGNLINIIVLIQTSRDKPMHAMERSANVGLLTLAMSDLFYCVSSLPKIFADLTKSIAKGFTFDLFYMYSHEALSNIFLFSSTWLTVTMAGSRYFAICKPLQARHMIDVKFAWISTAVVFTVAVLINIPRFLYKRFDHFNGYYLLSSAHMLNDTNSYLVYNWIFFIFSVLAPFIMLAAFNTLLSITLVRTTRLQSSIRATGSLASMRKTRRITAIFVIIIISYFVLVIPGKIHAFLRVLAATSTNASDHATFNVTVASLELCQASNFALNFLLYVTVSTSFRRKLCGIFCCTKAQENNTLSFSSKTSTTRFNSTKCTAAIEMNNCSPLLGSKI